jgi:hypothetical protein
MVLGRGVKFHLIKVISFCFYVNTFLAPQRTHQPTQQLNTIAHHHFAADQFSFVMFEKERFGSFSFQAPCTADHGFGL